MLDRPSDQTAYEDDAVEFGCSTDGYPSPFINWLKNGSPLSPDARTAIGQTRMRIEQVGIHSSSSITKLHTRFFIEIPPDSCALTQFLAIF